MRLLDSGSDHVIPSALYPEHCRVLARWYEYQGRGGEAAVALSNGNARFEAVDLLGRGASPVTSPLAFKPWQIRTIQIEAGR